MPVIPAGASLADSQVINMPGRMRSQGAPWRDGGGNRQYSMGVFGTLFQYSTEPPHTELIPWIATAWTANDDFSVYTVKLREDAVWQDGTPITASQIKAYWEHGAKPENIAGWGAASLALGTIKEWEALKAGDVTDVTGLQALDDHTLEITMEHSWPPWPLYMAVWMTGLSKIDQVIADENWWYDPIGAGPYDATYDPDSGLTESTRVELKGKSWWGEDSTVDKLTMPAISDRQVQVIMFENQEMDIIGLDAATYTQAVEDPAHPFNKLLHTALYPGLKWWGTMIGQAPLDDLNVRKGLAHGVDFESIIQAVLGRPWHAATGFFAPGTACHNSDDRGQYYDPDLARQYIADSSYGSGSNVPVLMTDLRPGEDVNVASAVKEYWKDNLNVELDIFKRESGMPRRPESQLKRFSEAMWVPHETQIVKTFTAKDIGVLPDVGGTEYTELDALENFARGLALDDPSACQAWQAVQEHYTDRVYMLPWNWLYGPNWAIHPWIKGFESGPNIDTPLWQMWVEKH